MPNVLQLLHPIRIILFEQVEDVLDIVNPLEEERNEHPLFLALLPHDYEFF